MYRRMIVQPSKQLTVVSNSTTKPRLLAQTVRLRVHGRSLASSTLPMSSHRIDTVSTRELQKYTAMPLEVTKSPMASPTGITSQLEQPNTNPQRTPSPTGDDITEHGAYSDYEQCMNGYNGSPVIEKWGPAVDAILKAIREAFTSSPHSSSPPGYIPSRGEFREYWWAVFTRLLERVETDATIPDQLASPPVTRFIVKLFDEPDSLGCPCCLPTVPPSIKLRNDQGVRKADLVRGLRDYLFGEAAPAVYAEGETNTKELMLETALLYSANWMSGGTDENGDKISLYDKVPEVFMYCCPADQYQAEGEMEGEEEDSEER